MPIYLPFVNSSAAHCRFRCLFPASTLLIENSAASDAYYKASDVDSFEFDAESVDSDADTNSIDSDADAASSDADITKWGLAVYRSAG